MLTELIAMSAVQKFILRSVWLLLQLEPIVGQKREESTLDFRARTVTPKQRPFSFTWSRELEFL